jgi:DUF1680 family protein
MKKIGSTCITDTSCSPYARLRPVPIEKVLLEDRFWAPRQRMLRETTLPSQYKLLEETGRIDNFRRVSGKMKDGFKGLVFNDSDVYKWVEAVAFSIAGNKSDELHRLIMQVIIDIGEAQDENGYLNTYFSFDRKKEKWTNLRDMHELYCAGHLIQAGIVHYRTTEERFLLDIACRFVDHIRDTFGPNKRLGTSGHPEIEMALVELYRTTRRKEYLDLACFFIDQRGKGLIGGGAYHIDHKPFRELNKIVGHAVRSIYLNCGAADIYMETGDESLLTALLHLWDNMTRQKMYVTGGLGARHAGESFGNDYELPSETAYAETCAAIANVMWNWRMLLITGEAKFCDVMELALYNGALSGISLDGQEYFYVNPLSNREGHRRQPWFECACCPPNIARLLAQLSGYFYDTSSQGVWLNLYAQSTANLDFSGEKLTLIQRTGYPWDGEIKVTVQTSKIMNFSIFLRIPGWSRNPKIEVNSEPFEGRIQPGTYVEVNRSWRSGDQIRLSLPMPVEYILCHPLVAENTDRVALIRGPLVYCVEHIDNPECNIYNIAISPMSKIKTEWIPDLLNGVVAVKGEGLAAETEGFEDRLYQRVPDVRQIMRTSKFIAIPYYAWANREPGPMIVWIRFLDKTQKQQ